MSTYYKCSKKDQLSKNVPKGTVSLPVPTPGADLKSILLTFPVATASKLYSKD